MSHIPGLRPTGLAARLFGSRRHKSADAPDPPDYRSAAEETARGNQQLAQWQMGANRPTQVTSTGYSTWSLRPGADPDNPQPGDWIQLNALSPDQQSILDRGENIQIGLGDTTLKGLANIQDIYSSRLTADGLPARSSAVIPENENSLEAQRQRAADTIYANNTRYMDKQFANEEASMRNRLLNQGLAEGSEAFRREMEDFSRQKNDAYAAARGQADAAGGGEQQRILQNLSNAVTLADQRRSNALDERAFLRQQPLNELNALMSRQQLPAPQGSAGFAQAGMVQGPDYASAANQDYQAAVQGVNAENAVHAQNTNTATSVASAILAYY